MLSFSQNAFLILLQIFFSVHTFANSAERISHFKFKSVTIDNGLSNNRTRATTKDRMGFIWFATDDGICRFDGLSTKTYNAYLGHKNEEYDQQFSSIYADKSGNLWAGACSFLRFNYSTEKLELVFDEDLPDQPNRIRAIIQDENNTIWLAARNGIFSMNSKLELNRLPPDTDGSYYEVWDLLILEKKIWMATRSNGVVVYNLSDSTYTKIPLVNEFGEATNVILCLHNEEGTIWVGTKNNGIYKINSNSYQLITHEYPDKNVRRIRDISRDSKNNLWLGTMDGLFFYSSGSGRYYRYAHKYHPMSSLTHNSVFDVFLDENEIMWLSTYAGGINYTDINKKPFQLIQARENDNNFLNNSIVSGFCVDKENNVYVGTDHGGLNYWDRQTQRFSYYPHAPGFVSGTNIKCMVSDTLGNIWIGTYEGGVSCFNPRQKSFKYYYSIPGNENSLQSNLVYSLGVDKNQNLWIGTNKGVDFLDTKSGVVSRKVSNEKIHSIYIDSLNIIWLGIDGYDMFCYDPENDIFKKCFENYKINTATALLRDSENHLWIGGKRGLSSIDLDDKQMYHFDKSDGLSSNIIFGIIEDDAKNLWVSSSMGLMKLVGAVSSPDSFNIRVFTIEDGLQSNQFWRNSAYKSDKGEFFFGGLNGFNYFFPDEIYENLSEPKMAFTDIKILNKTISINQEINGQVVLDKGINEKEELVLNHKQKVFTLEFVALHFSNPERNKYKYMLYPFEEEWNATEYPRNSATYTSLPAGQYIFKLRGSNCDGKWQSETRELKIRITPPIWKTWWFITLLCICFVIVVFFIFSTRMNRIRLKKINLEKLVEQRTRDLKKQTAQLRDSNNIKDKLFSIVAHDLKSPFQSILGFSGLLNANYEKFDDEKRHKYIQLISESAQKFYDLLENLLSWARTQTGAIPYEPQVIDISVLVKKVVDLHQHKIDNKQISLKNIITEPVYAFIDSQMIYSVIDNLIVNAVKFSMLKGQIQLDYKLDNENVIFSVTDNGVGMSKGDIDKLFIIGETVSKSGTLGEPGTGLGLIICKEFVEKNKGDIWVESGIGKGTTFFISLPVGEA